MKTNDIKNFSCAVIITAEELERAKNTSFTEIAQSEINKFYEDCIALMRQIAMYGKVDLEGRETDEQARRKQD